MAVNGFPVVDFHCDTLLKSFRKLELSRSNPGLQLDIPRLKSGGVKLQVIALCAVAQEPGRPVWHTMRLIDEFYRQLASSDAVVVRSRDELEATLQGDKVGFLLSIEGGESLGKDLGLLRIYHRLGVRAMTLVWNQANALADGVEEKRAAGLTEFGREVIAEMERLGMIVDVSHLPEPGFWDVAEVASRPFIASHSNARALCDHNRNLTDEQLQAIAASGGVVGINFFSEFLTASGKATVRNVVRHVLHIAEIAGWQHVGLGSDFDGITSAPAGLEHAGRFPRLSEALAAEGLSRDQIAGVMGGNFLRILRNALP